MYGLLFDSIQKFLRERYGEHYWANIRRRAKLKNHWFVTHEVYSDSLMKELVEAAAEELGEDIDTVMMMFGEHFVETIGHYGYARLLRVLGRDMRDFLNGLNDLHEYLRFSYPKMRPPGFLCESETPKGMQLHYTSSRQGFLCYVIGQLKTVGKIYGKELEVSVQSEEERGTGCHFILDLHFDNSEMLRQMKPNIGMDFSISSDVFLTIFPFCMVFDSDLVIQRVGNKLEDVLPGLSMQKVDQVFTLRKPHIGDITWNKIHMHTNQIFEVVSQQRVSRSHHSTLESGATENPAPPPQLRLKGQMKMMKAFNCMAFLGSPAMDSPEDLYESCIYISDLSMHDSSRDIILAGSQQNPELSLALDQEKIRSAQLEESVQRTDELLFQMIPKSIAEQLRNGETPLNTCQDFSSVSILFSDIVNFTSMCSRMRPMEVVCVLNAMYVAFDNLCTKHCVYKVETIGDAYMVLAGAPVAIPNHAEYIADFAISIVGAASKIIDPSTKKFLTIRIGIHSGPVVAGVVGASVLRYDVFGDTVNVAARMEATGEPMKVHISKDTADLLQDTDFIVEKRGEVEMKGKGMMTTYWIIDKKVSEDGNNLKLNPMQRFRQDHPDSSPSDYPRTIPEDISPSVRLFTSRDANALGVNAPFVKLINHSSTPKPEWPLVPSMRRSSLSVASAEEGPSLPVLHERQDISNTLLPIPEDMRTNPSQLAVYTALAKENVKQARKLADLLSLELSNVTAGLVDSIASSIPPEGTPVDAHLCRQCIMHGTSQAMSAQGCTSQQRTTGVRGTRRPGSARVRTSHIVSIGGGDRHQPATAMHRTSRPRSAEERTSHPVSVEGVSSQQQEHTSHLVSTEGVSSQQPEHTSSLVSWEASGSRTTTDSSGSIRGFGENMCRFM